MYAWSFWMSVPGWGQEGHQSHSLRSCCFDLLSLPKPFSFAFQAWQLGNKHTLKTSFRVKDRATQLEDHSWRRKGRCRGTFMIFPITAYLAFSKATWLAAEFLHYSKMGSGENTMVFLCPWDFPGKNTRVGCHSLLQGIFLNQGSNLGLLHCRQSLSYEPPGKPHLDGEGNVNWFTGNPLPMGSLGGLFASWPGTQQSSINIYPRLGLSGLCAPKKPLEPRSPTVVIHPVHQTSPTAFSSLPYPLTGAAARTFPQLACFHSFFKTKLGPQWDWWIIW